MLKTILLFGLQILYSKEDIEEALQDDPETQETAVNDIDMADATQQLAEKDITPLLVEIQNVRSFYFFTFTWGGKNNILLN